MLKLNSNRGLYAHQHDWVSVPWLFLEVALTPDRATGSAATGRPSGAPQLDL